MSALATLMYASAPIQKSICTGSVNRSRGLSSQCTLENLGPCLQQFPTLWKTLFSACFGQDEYGCLNYSPVNGFGKSSISEYLRWRYSIFSSAGGDTSLLQMLPCWVPKFIRRLIQLFEQVCPSFGNHVSVNTLEFDSDLCFVCIIQSQLWFCPLCHQLNLGF